MQSAKNQLYEDDVLNNNSNVNNTSDDYSISSSSSQELKFSVQNILDPLFGKVDYN